MNRQVQLNKTSQQKLRKFQSYRNLNENIFNDFNDIIVNDVKLIKECSEKSIVDFYISEFIKLLNKEEQIEYNDEFWNLLKLNTRTQLVKKYVSSKTFDNNIDIYFNEVKKEYILHPQSESEDIEFCEENRDIFIKNNLKLAINVAKRYRNLGLDFDDLIQVANLGLLTAFEKFDNERSNLRIYILKDIKSREDHQFSYEETCEIISKNFKYTKLLDSTLNKVPKDGFENKQEFIKWVQKYIKGASFSSISFFWIRAIIINELNNYSKIIKIPKATLKKNDDDFDTEDLDLQDPNDEESNDSVTIIRLDSINPYTDDNYNDNQLAEISNSEFSIEDSSMDNYERQSTFKEMISKLLYKLPDLDRRILIKKYGIGLPFPMSINEISENENISVNKIKYIINNSIKILQRHINDDDRKVMNELL